MCWSGPGGAAAAASLASVSRLVKPSRLTLNVPLTAELHRPPGSSQAGEKQLPVAATDPTRVFKRAASEQIVFTGRWSMKVATWIKAVGGHVCVSPHTNH